MFTHVLHFVVRNVGLSYSDVSFRLMRSGYRLPTQATRGNQFEITRLGMGPKCSALFEVSAPLEVIPMRKR